MAAQVLDGRKVADQVLTELKDRISSGIIGPLTLAIINTSDNPASLRYIARKQEAAQRVGITTRSFDASQLIHSDIMKLMRDLNADRAITGILLQLPVRSDLDAYELINLIAPLKDVDGLTATNVSALWFQRPGLYPCTPTGIMELLKRTGHALKGKHAVILGRSQIVGKPLATMLMNADATVTICHSQTQDLAKLTAQADILVSAIGKPGFVTAGMVKPGAIVIDVGISIVNDKLFGDVDFESVRTLAGFITPVPGGVGPMTVAMLLQNVYNAALLQVEE